MSPDDVVNRLKAWFTEERLTVKSQNDPRAHGHFMVKYPGGKQGHMFAVVVPKQRDLVAISSMTRVDEGQQQEMASHMDDEESDWSEWVHESRLHLIRTGVDWAIHMGHKGDAKPGILAFELLTVMLWLY